MPDPVAPLDADRLDAIEDAAREIWLDYQADLLRPSGVDDPDAVAEAIWHADLVLSPATDLAANVRERDALRADLAAAEADAALCRERLGDERERRRQAEAEVERLRDVVRVSEPQVMHPHMGGDHQVHYRGSMKNLTPEQWATIARAEKGDDDGE